MKIISKENYFQIFI